MKDWTRLDTMLGVSAAVGVTAGVILSLGMGNAELALACGIDQKLGLAASGDRLGVFLRSFFGVWILLAAAFFLGFSALGHPFELLLPAFRGMGLGLCVRGVYLSQNVLGSMCAFLPYAVLSTGVLFLMLRQSCAMSLRYLRLSATNGNGLGVKNEVREYILRFMIYTAILAAFSAADAYLAGIV